MGLFKDLYDMDAHMDDDELFDLFELEHEDQKKKAEAQGKKYDDKNDVDPWKW